MGIDWKSNDETERLLAAIIAACEDKGQKPNPRDIARFFGKGATYDAIEGRLRRAKKEAAKLKEEAPGADEVKSRGRSANSTPKKPKAGRDGVVNGRIEKTSPSKRGGAGKVSKVKLEDSISDLSFLENQSEESFTGMNGSGVFDESLYQAV